jgi:hypothetical protein
MPTPNPAGIGLRAYLLGLALCAFIGVGTAYNIMVIHGSYMAIDFSAAAAVFLFFLLTCLVNPTLKHLRPGWSLTSSEMKVIYLMTLVACAIPSMGLGAQLLPIITAPFYFATPENGWAELIQPRIRSWMVPQGSGVIRDFYEGSPGLGGVVPWAAWARPLLAWSPFLLALYVVSVAFMVLLRRQWMERERLVYPLAQLPVEMAELPESARWSPLYRQPRMWIGFGIAFVVASLTGLNHYFPSIPYLKAAIYVPIFRNTASLILRISMPMLGFFYLVHLDVGFSLWFFNLLSLAVRGLMKVYNLRVTENLGIYGSPSPVFAHQGMGAMMVLVFAGFWSARRHLADVFREAFRGAPDVDDRDEVLSYRATALCLILGLAFMAIWLRATGMPFWVVVVFLVAAFSLFIGLTRIVAESGMAEAVASTIGSSFVVSGFGSRAVGSTGLVALAMTYVWAADIRTFVMASTANGLKVMDGVHGNRRRWFWAILGAVVVTFLAATVTYLPLAYRHGGINGNDWFFGGGAVAPWEYVIGKLTNPEPPNWTGWVLKGAGAVGMTALMTLRTRFLWFPFHPIGFAVGPIWMMDQLWLTVFVAWAVKWGLLRVGGVRLYRKGRSFFLGLILGQFTCNGFWLVVDFITGTQGNQVFWI